jgi:hypothetical protein
MERAYKIALSLLAGISPCRPASRDGFTGGDVCTPWPGGGVLFFMIKQKII